MLNQLQHPHRRIFRGRGGATDRRLPKHNAARRRPPPPPQQHSLPSSLEETEIQYRLNDNAEDAVVDDDDSVNDNHDSAQQDSSSVGASKGLSSGFYSLQILEPAVDKEPQPSNNPETTTTIDVSQSTTTTAVVATPEQKKEMDHLQQRIRNNRSAMSLSSHAMNNPTSYQSNVLNACSNTMKEYKSILRQYPSLDVELKKSISGPMFELIQQSIQCGPLAGSKPGYFKRCGTDIAMMVHKYLLDMVPNKMDAMNVLCFTSTQADAIEKWKDASHKATLANKPPSKSFLQRRQKVIKGKG